MFSPWLAIMIVNAATMGPTPPVDPQLEPLHNALVQKDISQAISWIRQQQSIGNGKRVVGELIHLLSSSDPTVRWAAARMLPRLGQEAVGALPHLVKAIHDVDPMVRWAAADALRALAPKSPDGLDILIATMEEQDPLVRWAAIGAVAELGPDAQRAAPTLFQLLQDENVVVRREAARTLRAVFPEPAIGANLLATPRNSSGF